MSLAVINGATVIEFVEDLKAFEDCVKEWFELLDFDVDGVLSRAELHNGFCKLLSSETDSRQKQDIDNICNAIFDRFDEDKNGSLDRNEFNLLMKEIMLAMARGLGNLPVLVALANGSLLMKAVQHECAKK